MSELLPLIKCGVDPQELANHLFLQRNFETAWWRNLRGILAKAGDCRNDALKRRFAVSRDDIEATNGIINKIAKWCPFIISVLPATPILRLKPSLLFWLGDFETVRYLLHQRYRRTRIPSLGPVPQGQGTTRYVPVELNTRLVT